MPKITPAAARRGPDHLDEIAGLLAGAYLRLRAKRATAHTSGQKDADKSAVRLDVSGQSERSWDSNHLWSEGGRP
jgi:hypothetical protein